LLFPRRHVQKRIKKTVLNYVLASYSTSTPSSHPSPRFRAS
jgi:hypothetical protein